jgi:peptide/nickel transport system permease protein
VSSVPGAPNEVPQPASASEVEIAARSPLRPMAMGGAVRKSIGANASLVVGATMFGILILIGVFAGVIAPYDPVKQDLTSTLLPPFSAGHLLGTDQLGRDTLSRLIYGARNDILIAVVAVILPFLFGTLIGIIVGYRGGWIDSMLVGVIDIVIAFPILVLLIALVFVLGPGVTTIIISVTLVDWVVYARLARTSARRDSAMEYILAAQVGGVPTWRILGRHLLPNIITQSVVYAMSDAVLVILFLTTLGYLGLGIPAPAPDWGSMIFEAQPFLNKEWWLAVIPGVAIIITAFSLSLIADGLAHRLDAR